MRDQLDAALVWEAKPELDRLVLLPASCGPSEAYGPRLSNIYQSQLASLIAHGTNLGIAAMGHSAEGITADMLQHVRRFFSDRRDSQGCQRYIHQEDLRRRVKVRCGAGLEYDCDHEDRI
jgi:Tn3 transposase DDE domain